LTDLYVDTSALLKRVFTEEESPQVRAILRERNAAGDLIASSELAWVEVARAISRAGVTGVGELLRVACTGIARQPLTPAVMQRARTIGPAGLRALDAIHLSAAISLGAVEMLTFDRRLAEAAESVGVKAIP
jgi:predicted nucleic acid-binding protein